MTNEQQAIYQALRILGNGYKSTGKFVSAQLSGFYTLAIYTCPGALKDLGEIKDAAFGLWDMEMVGKL